MSLWFYLLHFMVVSFVSPVNLRFTAVMEPPAGDVTFVRAFIFFNLLILFLTRGLIVVIINFLLWIYTATKAAVKVWGQPKVTSWETPRCPLWINFCRTSNKTHHWWTLQEVFTLDLWPQHSLQQHRGNGSVYCICTLYLWPQWSSNRPAEYQLNNTHHRL